ncbi:MAG: hypothetical protein N2C12_06195 [Planctomycetales bacterium]
MADDVRRRLQQLPPEYVAAIDVIQFSRMTRKKEFFPCYGMQWGSTIYLYPAELDLVEHHSRPPDPNQRQEAQMYGARWIHEAEDYWKLVWNEQSIRDYYLNNILIHELGHLLDERNSKYDDREKFAEWFALEYGYKRSKRPARQRNKPRRRHHRC